MAKRNKKDYSVYSVLCGFFSLFSVLVPAFLKKGGIKKRRVRTTRASKVKRSAHAVKRRVSKAKVRARR